MLTVPFQLALDGQIISYTLTERSMRSLDQVHEEDLIHKRRYIRASKLHRSLRST